MSELTLTVLRLGFLVLLWVFVVSIVGVLRRDLFGTRVVQRQAGRTRPAASPSRPAKPAKPAKPARGERRVPTSLVVTEGSLKGTTIALASSPVLIGRSPECTLVLDDDYSSGRHARLFPSEGRWMVEDLGSTNGTLVGRTQLTAPTPVEPGTQLRIGRTVLELRK
ncbi:MAG TPA: FHA domain-containing protein [Actinomycetales bacterium]|nr:FHA domain-containing protein [Actinomycetales bacterium]